MKTMPLCALFILLVLTSFSACADSQSPYAATPEEDPVPQVVWEPTLENATIEYGAPDLITDNVGPLFAYIRFPQSGEATDYLIARWAQEIYQSALDEIEAQLEEDPEAGGEINVQFNSYLVDGRYAGIMERGMFTGSHMIHPQDIIRTFNIDTENGVLLDNDDILDPLRSRIVLKLLREQLLEAYPDAAGSLGEAEESWLKHIALGTEGLHVEIERGVALPEAVGRLSVTLPYDGLGAALRLGATPPELPDDTVATAQVIPVTPPVPWRSNQIDPEKPMVALTFDDGPSIHTEKILDLLEQYDSRATFFVIGNLVESRRETIERAFDMGSEIMGHSWDHRNLTKLSAREISTQVTDTANAIESVTGLRPQMYRTPYGAVNDRVRDVSGELGFAIISWSVDPRDWQTRNTDAVHAAIMRNVKDRAIILSHDLYGTTADAMERVIPELLELGYQLVTVSELMFYSDITLEAGVVYYRGQ